MAEFEQYLPLLGLTIPAVVTIIVKKMDLGKTAKDKVLEKVSQIEEKLRQHDIDIEVLKRNHNR